jgi:hypothetical protein
MGRGVGSVDDDVRAERHDRVQPRDVVVAQADAAVRDGLADRLGPRRAVQRVAVAEHETVATELAGDLAVAGA